MDGPIRCSDCPALIEVVAAAGVSHPVVGEAKVAGMHPDRGGPVVLFQLRIGGEPVGELWECRRRQFVRWGVQPASR
jgi:hypothetical protein